MAHRIRLGPPWEVTTIEGRTRHARRFGRPRTLDAAEQVWLVCDSLPAGSEILLNDVAMGTATSEPFAIDITPHLNSRNQVVIDSPSDAPLGEFAMEIRPV